VEVFSGSNGFEMGENGCGEERDALLLYLCCRQLRAGWFAPRFIPMVPSESAERLSGSTVSEWRCFLVRTDSKWVRTVAEKRGTRSYCTSAVGNFATSVRTQIHSNGSK
jgi:hypothetical protein